MSEWIIPPGEESLAAAMLGKGEKPAGCELTAAAIDKTKILGTYQCGEAKAQVVLEHVSKGAGTKTAQFDVASGDPAASAELLADIATRVRANEAGWQWVDATTLQKPPGPAPAGADAASGPNPAMWAGLVLLLGLVLFFVLRRRAPPPIKGP